jgi:phosphoribosylformylglycinamidine (FGAM) synthase-like amidotransferase family enzyme
VTLRYVDSLGQPTQHYPLNPNGSPDAITGVTSKDGRATIMMPHPERNFRAIQHSWNLKAGLKMVHGYVCSVMHVNLLVNC